MILYLIRHGIAEEHAAGGDSERALTDEGREKLETIFKRAAAAGVKPGRILSSPYRRALQTAKLAAKILDAPDSLETPALIPYATPREVWNEIRTQGDVEELLCASHEPLCSRAASYLLNAPALQVDFKKGAMLAIGFDSLRGEPRGVLRWLLTPKLCQ